MRVAAVIFFAIALLILLIRSLYTSAEATKKQQELLPAVPVVVSVPAVAPVVDSSTSDKPKESISTLSEAIAITEKRKSDRTPNRPPPVLDEARLAQDKRALELARLRGELTFDDLKFNIEKDGVFEESMLSDEIRKLHGKNVRIRGFMLPSSVFQTKGIKQFVLVRDNNECCFGPGAAIYDCIMVQMGSDKSAEFNSRPITLNGVLSIDTETYQYPDGGHYAIYKIIASEAK